MEFGGGGSRKSSRDEKAKTRRVLPRIPSDVAPVLPPATSRSSSRRSSQAQDSSLDLTNVTDLSQTSVLEAGSIIGGAHPPRRDFVSPVKLVAAEDGVDSSVTVAVRVRPLSDREHRLGAQQVIRMHGNETIITSKSGVIHRFFYDHCFWSVDESSPQHADQGVVYTRLAQPLLDWSFEGFNTCLFAYGQTGSGKSYCIMGEGEHHGIVPQFAKELFDRVEGTTDDETTFKVQVSYYEIYKEKIFDLLASTKHKSKTKLRVREHPVMGPYVEDLSTFVANSYSDIERWINLGNRFRATAATGMNDRSSRSHSVFTILLTQTSILEGEEHSRVSRINLIDLAGSERSSVAQTSGERLKEGASINRSLHTLGKVISLLSDRSTGKRRKVYIPYRDSTLTWLLKESLGGNSRTAMIATISPADTHYEESLSTLRYAQQARTIINVARINEDPNARIIRDLRQEIEYLRSLVGGGGGGGMDQSNMAELQLLREKLMESEKLMNEASRSWQEKLAQTEARKREEMEELKRSGALKVNNRLPNLVNLTDDPQLSEMLLYVLKEGVTTVGRQGGGASSQSHDIELKGALVMENHCVFMNDDSAVRLEPSANSDAQTYVNGMLITSPTQLHHGDRVVLGGEYYFRFNHPLRAGEEGSTYNKGQGTFEYAKNELIQAQTARLEAELEERRLREREELMCELQAMKEAAQTEMDRQKTDYETRISQLSKDMEEQSIMVSLEQQSKLEARSKMDELLRQKELLEEENMAQKHLIQLEKLKAEKEYAEMKEQKSRLMAELEQEKMKLEGDINKLQRNKQMRLESSKRDSTSSLGGEGGGLGEGSILKGSELMRVAMMLQEASAICKGLNKPLIFTRDELVSESGHTEVHIRVNNTLLGLVTYWDLAKFETRLDQMRDIYQAMPTPGSTSSLDSDSINLSGGEDQGDPFNDPTDNWIKDSVITPLPSPHRTTQLRRSLLSSNSSPILLSSPLYGKMMSSGSTAASGSAHSSRSLVELLSTALGSGSRTSSPAHLTPSSAYLTPGSAHPIPSSSSYSQLSQSLPRLCSDNIGKLLSFKEDGLHHKVTVFQLMLDHTHQLRSASHSLEDLFDKYAPTPDLNLPFSATSEVRVHSLSLYCGLELLLNSAKSLWEQCHTHPRLTTSTPICGTLSQQSCDQLLSTISQQTALYCSKLLQGVDHGVEDTIRESRCHLEESLEGVASLIGQLSLARRHHNGFVIQALAMTTKEEVFPEINDDFLSIAPYRQLSSLFYVGHRDWCSAVIDHASHTLQDSLHPLAQAPPHSPVVDEIVAAVKKVIAAVLTFLQSLSSMQASIWSDAGESDSSRLSVGTLPPVPNLHHVTGMLVLVEHVHQGTLTLTQLASHLGREEDDPGEINNKLEKLSMSNSQVALCCNELAASLLTVIKSAPCVTGKELSSQVQSLSHEIARAGKNVNHLLKKRGVSTGSSRRNSRATTAPLTQVMQSNVAMTKSTTSASTVEESRKRGSLAGVQTLDEKPTGVLVGERASRRKSSAPPAVESRNYRIESTSTGISTVVEHRSNADTTPTISAGDITDLERDEPSEKSSESTPNCSNSAPVTGQNGNSIAARGTPTKTTPPSEETVSVRHSNATGQVISDSPTHSPPHHTSAQLAGVGLTSSSGSGVGSGGSSAPKQVLAKTLAAEQEDSSVI